MDRNLLRQVALGCVLLTVGSLVPALAQQGPSDILVYSRFKLDQKFKTIGRLSKADIPGDVLLVFVCPGDSEGFCPMLEVTFPLERNETAVFNVADLDPPCNEGFFVALGAALTGSFEIFKGKVGKIRESDNAIPVGGTTAGVVLASDVRGTAGKDASYLTLADLQFLNRGGLDNLGDPVFPQPVEITGASGDGSAIFTVDREFTCYERVKLDELSSRFRRQTLGDYGSIVVRALPRDDGGLIFITGAIGETGKGSQSMRPMFDATPPSGIDGER